MKPFKNLSDSSCSWVILLFFYIYTDFMNQLLLIASHFSKLNKNKSYPE